jgi:hypothetical protein
MSNIFQRIFGRPEVDTSYQDFQMEEARRARSDEEARQLRIDNGMRRIAAIFDGGTFRPMVNPPLPTANDHTAINAALQPGRVAQPGEAFEGMNPLLAQREKAQKDFYLPQLDRQRDNAQKELTFALARAGLLNSSTAGERQGDLGQDFALERGATLSKIASDIAGRKTWLNQQRAAIEGGLRASGDQTGASNQALSTMASFAEDQPTMNPLGHLFAGVSEGIGSAQRGAEAAEIRRTYGADPLRTRTGRVVGM